MVAGAERGDISALYVVGADPALALPGEQKVRAALDKRDSHPEPGEELGELEGRAYKPVNPDEGDVACLGDSARDRRGCSRLCGGRHSIHTPSLPGELAST